MANVATSIPSVETLMDTPLPVLINELGVTLIDSSITDADFFGAVVERKTGELLLTLPAGRSDFERDTVARFLLAQALGVPVAPLPEPLMTSRSVDTLATLGETSEEEHEKAKEPLPTRPRGPHPYPQGVTS
ncbi:hypothetical protein DF19_39710 [Streptomyces sp. F-3]|uniref:hypothetical protein n=1 Tax=Streptomyces sp. F-3 TaxID=1840095 RepID=UPI0007C37497|nr:hypothetical protein [Streptomyces sp. F-3]GAT81093.1 hypothetical protein DF19_39710 [Streptomyces sp. F-3]